jgi:SAM-dependent methyltransferase
MRQLRGAPRCDGIVAPRPERPAAYRGPVAKSLDPHLLAELAGDPGGSSGGSIWRDPHVQRQLLAVHLDDSTVAATRSPEAVRRTLELLTDGLAPGASVLDLGCGPGRYAQQLADDGFDVTGVDFNGASIEHARRRARGRVQYVEADYTRELPEGPFDLAMLIYLDFGTHLPPAQRCLLGEVRRRLRPGGRLVLDYLDAPVADRPRAGRAGGGSAAGGGWAPGPHLVLSATTVERALLARRIRYTLLTEVDVRRFDVWEHCFAEHTIRAMLAEAGFVDVGLQRSVLTDVDPLAEDVVFAVARV